MNTLIDLCGLTEPLKECLVSNIDEIYDKANECADRYVAVKYINKIVPSNENLKNHLTSEPFLFFEHRLPKIEISEMIEQIVQKYIEDGTIYEYKNWNSYVTNVLNKNMKAFCENYLIGDEFPFDRNGRYISPAYK